MRGSRLLPVDAAAGEEVIDDGRVATRM